MRSIKSVIAVIVLAVTAVIAGVAVRADQPAPLPHPGTGVGEDLILVVADQQPSLARARRALARTAAGFSDVQGFYAARADDYRVTGVHLQVSPDLLEVACSTPGRLVAPLIGGLRNEIECPDTSNVVRVLQPIELRFVPRAAFNPTGRWREILGDRVAFRPGAHLLVTAFRTRTGAEEFLDLARTLGLRDLITVSARKLGGGFVGLGQEAHPDGSGPLLGPLDDQVAFQR